LAKEGPWYEKRDWNHLYGSVSVKKDDRGSSIARSVIESLARRQGVSDGAILRVILGEKEVAK
jgi:hypothetical protein